MKKLAAALVLLAAPPALADVMPLPREIMIDEAAVIVVGKVAKIDNAGAGEGREFAVIDVTEVLKGDPKVKEVKVWQAALMGARLSHRTTINVGERGVFALNAVPGKDAFRFGHPAQVSITTDRTEKAVVDDFRKIIAQRAELKGGKPVNGLIARAEVLREGGAPSVRFSLKNVSDKPVVVCDYVGNRPLDVKWVGPDGKELESPHYEWLKSARLRPIAAGNFVTIPPGGVHFVGPHGRGIFDAFRFDTAPKGKNRVTIGYTNKATGEEFKLKGVWTGTVIANEVTFTR